MIHTETTLKSSIWIPAFAGMTLFFMLLSFPANAGEALQKQPPQILQMPQPAAQPSSVAESPQLQKCLKRADELPDMAAIEAEVWIKKNGGDEAHLCRAFAQGNRGMHEDAAREFWALASSNEKKNPARALLMHNFSGQEFLRAKKAKIAEAQYAAALKIAPNNVTSLVGRAETRMEVERYWEALDDLNRALKISPDDLDALRQRGRAWAQLGNEKNAQDDLQHAAALSGD